MNSQTELPIQSTELSYPKNNDVVEEFQNVESLGHEFLPYEASIICQECEHHIILLFQPVHLKIETHCPKCLYDMTCEIRNHILLHARVKENQSVVLTEDS